MICSLSNSSICDDLECPWRSFPYCKPFEVHFFPIFGMLLLVIVDSVEMSLFIEVRSVVVAVRWHCRLVNERWACHHEAVHTQLTSLQCSRLMMTLEARPKFSGKNVTLHEAALHLVSTRFACLLCHLYVFSVCLIAVLLLTYQNCLQSLLLTRSWERPSYVLPIVFNLSEMRLRRQGKLLWIYRVAQNKIPHQTICNIFATSDQILNILEAV